MELFSLDVIVPSRPIRKELAPGICPDCVKQELNNAVVIKLPDGSSIEYPSMQVALGSLCRIVAYNTDQPPAFREGVKDLVHDLLLFIQQTCDD